MDGEHAEGLSSLRADELLGRFGSNTLPEPRPRSFVRRFAGQLQNALIYLLLAALVLDFSLWLATGGRGVPTESLAILGVMLLNAALGVTQEYKSERALSLLKELGAPRAWVLRDGSLAPLDARRIVPGDVVRLEAGERVPADGKLLSGEALGVDESVITGEAAAVEKAAADELLSGTLVVRGHGLIEVTHTGLKSRMGRLAQALSTMQTSQSPLERRIGELGRALTVVVTVLCLVLITLGVAFQGIASLREMVLFGVALAVAIVPEGLPVMMTLALALGVQRMARRHALVRRLASVEALGAVTVLASDKTGTLTENRLTVAELASDHEDRALMTLVLANDAEPDSAVGDPLELALLRYATERGVDVRALRQGHPRVSSRAFDSQWRFMQVTTATPEGMPRSFIKGAVEVVLERCTLSDERRAEWRERAERQAALGYKVLGVATGNDSGEREWTFAGMISLWDPPRAEAAAAVHAAERAGIRVLMVTGDHPLTAAAIATKVGLANSEVMTGERLQAMSKADVDSALKRYQVFARMLPEHKLWLVERLRARGEIVAVTGDGINDALALKRADVGVAMGLHGSQVAREAADLVLLDDNFATLVAAVEEGRGIDCNIRNFIRFSLASNFALLLVVLGAGAGSLLLGLTTSSGALLLPLTPLQILWINFFGDGLPALALALDCHPGSLRSEPRRLEQPLLDSRSLRFIACDGVIKAVFGLGLLASLPRCGVATAAISTILFLYQAAAKLLSIYPARRLSGIPANNPTVHLAIAAALVIQGLCLVVPAFRHLLGLSPISLQQCAVAGGALLAAMATVELMVRSVSLGFGRYDHHRYV